jgi:hypothetical protein
MIPPRQLPQDDAIAEFAKLDDDFRRVQEQKSNPTLSLSDGALKAKTHNVFRELFSRFISFISGHENPYDIKHVCQNAIEKMKIVAAQVSNENDIHKDPKELEKVRSAFNILNSHLSNTIHFEKDISKKKELEDFQKIWTKNLNSTAGVVNKAQTNLFNKSPIK